VHLWHGYVHPRVETEHMITRQLDHIFRTVSESCHRNLDPIVDGSDASFISDDFDQCIHWYGMTEMVSCGDCIEHQGQEHPIIDLEGETAGLKRRFSVTKLLMVLFGDDGSASLCLTLPRDRLLPMKCGSAMCINMRHIATEKVCLPVVQPGLGSYGRDTQAKPLMRFKMLQEGADGETSWPSSTFFHGGFEQGETTAESDLLNFFSFSSILSRVIEPFRFW
jgi:hypothetical protein